MVQETYISTYRKYKTGTKQLTTWLVFAARRCGIDVLPCGAYEIPLGKFIDLAISITTSKEPRILVPKEILTVLDTVIGLRKTVGKYKAKTTGTCANDNSHQHFITVLEQVRDILSEPTGSTPKPSANGEKLSTGPGISNMFAALSVEQPSPSNKSTQTLPAKEAVKSQRPKTYGMEANEDDSLFAVVGFLEDLAHIREVLARAWEDHRNGYLDIMSAAVTTDTAYGIIKRNCDDLLDVIPSGVTYVELPGVFALTNLKGGNEKVKKKQGSISLNLADGLATNVRTFLQALANLLHECNLPLYCAKRAHFHIEPCLKQISTRVQEDIATLAGYLSEITKLCRTKVELPVEDELTIGLRTMMDSKDLKRCPMHVIFNTIILLDINHILGAHTSYPFYELQQNALFCKKTIDSQIDCSTSLHWPTPHDETLLQLRTFAQELIFEDETDGTPARKGQGKSGKPLTSKFLQQNPVICGIIDFRLNILRRDVGLALINTCGTAMFTIHLYNACRQSGGLKCEWEDAEYLYQLHDSRHLFVGPPPKDPEDYLKRLLLVSGASAMNFASNKRQGDHMTVIQSKKGPRGFKTTSPVREAFHPRYVKGGNALLNKSSIIALANVGMKAQRIVRPITTTGVDHVAQYDVGILVKEIEAQSHITPLQLLMCVREGVAAEEMHLLLDYFSIHQQSILILHELKDAIHPEIIDAFGAQWLDHVSMLPHMVGYLFRIMADPDCMVKSSRLATHDRNILSKASGALSAFLERDRSSSLVVTEARMNTYAFRFACAMGKDEVGKVLIGCPESLWSGSK